jgi:hypothetical protein
LTCGGVCVLKDHLNPKVDSGSKGVASYADWGF